MTVRPRAPAAASGAQAATGSSPAVRVAILLAEEPERDWRIADLAGAVNLSPSQLGRVFRREVDMTPMQYLSRLRAHRLARILIETDLPVSIAIERAGWRSRGHASRRFTEALGTTPSEFRRRHRTGTPPS